MEKIVANFGKNLKNWYIWTLSPHYVKITSILSQSPRAITKPV